MGVEIGVGVCERLGSESFLLRVGIVQREKVRGGELQPLGGRGLRLCGGEP